MFYDTLRRPRGRRGVPAAGAKVPNLSRLPASSVSIAYVRLSGIGRDVFSMARTVAGRAGSDFVLPAHLAEVTLYAPLKRRASGRLIPRGFPDLAGVNLCLTRVSEFLRYVSGLSRNVAELLRNAAELSATLSDSAERRTEPVET